MQVDPNGAMRTKQGRPAASSPDGLEVRDDAIPVGIDPGHQASDVLKVGDATLQLAHPAGNAVRGGRVGGWGCGWGLQQ